MNTNLNPLSPLNEAGLQHQATTPITTPSNCDEDTHYSSDIQEDADDAVVREMRERECRVGCFVLKTMNQWIDDAAAKPDPISLYNHLWFQGEISCLFADTNVGKSVLAVQIGEDIARSGEHKVVYVDCELSDKQVEARYRDKELYSKHRFPDGFYRVEMAPGEMPTEDVVLSTIFQTAEQTGAKFVIVDNLSWLCMNAEDGKDAGKFMQQLRQGARAMGYSVLVVAHTPKIFPFQPLTNNNLAGSKKLSNFFDSIFAMGASTQGNNIRYIKQTKVRAEGFTYPASNVLTMELTKADGWLHFVPRGTCTEAEHLDQRPGRDDLANKVLELREQGKSLREIARETGWGKDTINKIIHNDALAQMTKEGGDE